LCERSSRCETKSTASIESELTMPATPAARVTVAEPRDAEAIAALLHNSFKEYEAQYTPAGFAATTPTAAEINQRMSEGPVWVILENEVLLGTVSAVLTNDGLYVRGMAVSPAARGRQLGRRLLDRVEKYAVLHGCPQIFLSTTPFLSRAIRLYESSGYRRRNIGPDSLFGTPLFSLVKPLSVLRLRPTLEQDLDYVVAAENHEDNRAFVGQWTIAEHQQALGNRDIAHLIVQADSNAGYVVVAGLLNPHRRIEMRRLVITEKGRGYGRAAVERVKELAFLDQRAHRLWLDVKEQNTRARSLYDRSGFTVEGTLRECLYNNGYESLVVMSILEHEYVSLKR